LHQRQRARELRKVAPDHRRHHAARGRDSGDPALALASSALPPAVHIDRRSWLKLVDRWFAAPTQNQLWRDANRNTRKLEDAIRRCLEIDNQHQLAPASFPPLHHNGVQVREIDNGNTLKRWPPFL